jgi:hypothetical protein
VKKHTNIYNDRQRDKQNGILATYRQIYRQAGSPAGRQAERQTDIQTDKRTDRQTDRQTDRKTDRKTDVGVISTYGTECTLLQYTGGGTLEAP